MGNGDLKLLRVIVSRNTSVKTAFGELFIKYYRTFYKYYMNKWSFSLEEAEEVASEGNDENF